MQLPNGATLDIASTYGTSSVMSALSNAASAVGTLAAGHSVGIGDLVEMTSGWGDIDGQIAKATAVATNDVTFGGIDTGCRCRARQSRSRQEARRSAAADAVTYRHPVA